MQAQATMIIQLDIIKAFPDSAQHAETQHIDLEKAKRLDIFLAPLDYASPLHGCRFLRQQAIERFIGEYETTRMDSQVARKPVQLIAQLHPVFPVYFFILRVLLFVIVF